MESEDTHSGKTKMAQKSLVITQFPNTISSGKILYRYLFFSYPYLPSHLSLYTGIRIHIYRSLSQRVTGCSQEVLEMQV